MSRPLLRIPLHILPFLGKVPDTAIAAQIGRSSSAVSSYRRRKGIPAFEGKSYDAAALAAAGVPRHVTARASQPPTVDTAPVVVAMPAPVTVTVEKEVIPPSIRKALSSGRPVSGGVLIPYNLFAEAIEAAKV
jgi:hypothetical protein